VFGEGKDVMGIRRVRWIAIGSAVFAAGATLAIGANAFASQGAARCVPPSAGIPAHNPSGHNPSGHNPSGHNPSGHNPSWRSGAFQAAGCRAWRHMHHHQVLTRTAPR
jgi:hypothetical protein